MLPAGHSANLDDWLHFSAVWHGAGYLQVWWQPTVSLWYPRIQYSLDGSFPILLWYLV